MDMVDIEAWLVSEEPILLKRAASMAPDMETARDWVAEARLKVLLVAREQPNQRTGYYAQVANRALITMLRASKRRYRNALLFSQCPTSTAVQDQIEGDDGMTAFLSRMAVVAMSRSARPIHGDIVARAIALLADGLTWAEIAKSLNLKVEEISVIKASTRDAARAYYNQN
jgi:hypothetical protein